MQLDEHGIPLHDFYVELLESEGFEETWLMLQLQRKGYSEAIASIGITGKTDASCGEIASRLDHAARELERLRHKTSEPDYDPAIRLQLGRYAQSLAALTNLNRTVRQAEAQPPQPIHPETLHTVEQENARVLLEVEQAGVSKKVQAVLARGLHDRVALWERRQREPYLHRALLYQRDVTKYGQASEDEWSALPAGIHSLPDKMPWIYKREGAELLAFCADMMLQKMNLRIGHWNTLSGEEERAVGLPWKKREWIYVNAAAQDDPDAEARGIRNLIMEEYFRGRAANFSPIGNETLYEVCFELPLFRGLGK